MHKPPAAVLFSSADDVEQQFYEALQQGDLERLMRLWADDDEIVCVHPGGGRVVGVQAIRESFAAIFGHGAIPVTPEHVHRLETADAAVHHLVERISVQTHEGPQVGWVLATNVYVKTGAGWRMASHHASPAPEAPAAPAREAGSTLH